MSSRAGLTPCRFFLAGRCARSTTCAFSHDVGSRAAAETGAPEWSAWLARAESWLLTRPDAETVAGSTLPELAAVAPLPSGASVAAASARLRADSRFCPGVRQSSWTSAAYEPSVKAAAAAAAPVPALGGGGGGASLPAAAPASPDDGPRRATKAERRRKAAEAEGAAPTLAIWVDRVVAYLDEQTKPPIMYWAWTLPRLMRDVPLEDALSSQARAALEADTRLVCCETSRFGLAARPPQLHSKSSDDAMARRDRGRSELKARGSPAAAGGGGGGSG